jgi:hypothetical protein
MISPAGKASALSSVTRMSARIRSIGDWAVSSTNVDGRKSQSRSGVTITPAGDHDDNGLDLV